MAPLDTGRYILTNVKYQFLAMQPDAHPESEIVAGLGHHEGGDKWNIAVLSNKKYEIKSYGYSLVANYPDRPKQGDRVRGLRASQQWIIKHTGVIHGQYLISTIQGDLYWGLADSRIDTPVTLETDPTDPANIWVISPTGP